MNLRDLMKAIINSAPEDWHLIGEQPTYRNHLQFHEFYGGQANVLHAEAHHSVGVYIPDVSITVAWGLQWNDDFREDWCKNFPDPKAHGCYLDVFFNNAMVSRAAYVWVDGIKFPLPRHGESGGLEVTKNECALMKTIDALGKAPRPDFNSYETDIKRAGFMIVDEEWPKFPRKPSVYEKRGVLGV